MSQHCSLIFITGVPSYSVSEDNEMVKLFLKIVGPTVRDSIELNLTILDPSDPGM